jgi:DNA-binding MarR family transcriptional regulator
VSDTDLATDALGRLFGLTPRLTELMDLGAQQYGFGYARGRVLWVLRASGPVLMRAVSDTLGVTPRTLTGLIDALEADGWVIRKPHPTDRRATLLELTPAAEQSCARIEEAFQTFAHLLFDTVTPADLHTFLRVLTHVRDHLDTATSLAQNALDSGQPPPLARHDATRTAEDMTTTH